ncbi:MAG TPA: CHAD domain-containing protein [Vicinamibacterales bacterium]|nr:CHAD domain-containing protein [Vicinamibacterales bacterium]
MAHATTSITVGLARALQRRLRVLSKELPRARRGEGKSVHRARVASRRLREGLAAIESGSRGLSRSARRDLRRVTHALGGVREMDVALALLEEEGAARGWPNTAVAAVAKQCEALRDRRRKQLADALDRADVTELVDAIGEIGDALDTRSGRTRPASQLASRLRKRAREFQRALAAAGTLYAPVPLHATRLAAKKLRYTLELAQEAARLPVTGDLRQLEALQEMLGRMHDFQIVQEQLQVAMAARDPAAGRGLEVLDGEIERTCRELHAKFLAGAPRLSRLADRVSRDVTLRLVEKARQPMAKMAAPRAPRTSRTSRSSRAAAAGSR